MKRHDGLIICDAHKREGVDKDGNAIWHGDILDDGVTIIPGYIEVNKDHTVRLASSDPNNASATVGVLTNRRKDDNGNNLISKTIVGEGTGTDEELHFCNKVCMDAYLLAKEQENERENSDNNPDME